MMRFETVQDQVHYNWNAKQDGRAHQENKHDEHHTSSCYHGPLLLSHDGAKDPHVSSFLRFARDNAEPCFLCIEHSIYGCERLTFVRDRCADTGDESVSLQPLAQAANLVYNTVRRWVVSKACPTKRSDVIEEVNQDGSLPGLWPITARRM